GLAEAEQVVVALEVAPVRVAVAVLRVGATAAGEALAAVAGFVQAVGLQHRAHGAVNHEDAARQLVQQGLDAIRVQPGKGAHGLRASSDRTSKCGGRFSRVTVSACWTSSPALPAIRRSSRRVKPRLAWP